MNKEADTNDFSDTENYNQIDQPLLGNPDEYLEFKKPGPCGKGFAWCVRATQPDFHLKKGAYILFLYSLLLNLIGLGLFIANAYVYEVSKDYTNL